MKLKITGILLLFTFIFSAGTVFAAASKASAPSSLLYEAVNKYRQKNYTGCIQDMSYVIENSRPTDIAYYYKALSYAQLGMTKEAREAYEAARTISKNRVLIDYSNQAIGCIDDPASCDTNLGIEDITTFIKSEQFMHPDVIKDMQNKSIEKVKVEINGGEKPSAQDLKYLNNNDQPTDKEIADAMRTFSKLGISPFGGMYGNLAMYDQNPELMLMSAFLGAQNSNEGGMMSIIPMLSAMQPSEGKSGMNKELIQAMVMNQLLPGLNFRSSDK